MKMLNCSTSACRVCHYYRPEGRRGGVCQQLGVPVSANWKACSLAVPAFTPSWDTLKEILQNEPMIIEKPIPVNYSIDCSKVNLREDKSSTTSKTLTADVVLV